MNRKIKFIRPTATALGLAFICLTLSTAVMAGGFRVKITRIAAESANGDVIIYVKPGTNERDFTGTARAMLVGSDPGTNRAMATLLTATSMGVEVFINVANPPSYDDIQVITRTSLIPP